MLRFGLLCVLIGLTAGRVINLRDIDDLVDEVLYTAKEYMIEYKLDTMPLPDVNLTLDSTPIGPWVLTGTVETSGGTVKNTTSIKRVGDAVVLTPGDNDLYVSINVTFDVMQAHFDVFHFTMSGVSGDGGLDLGIGQNTVLISFTVIDDLSGFCNVTIDEAKLTDLGGIDIHLLPSSIWNTIKNKAADLYFNHNIAGLEQAVTQFLKPILQMAIDKVNPCQYLPF